jgi:hypothetical protein
MYSLGPAEASPIKIQEVPSKPAPPAVPCTIAVLPSPVTPFRTFHSAIRTHAHPLAALSDRFCSSPLWIHANASNTRPPTRGPQRSVLLLTILDPRKRLEHTPTHSRPSAIGSAPNHFGSTQTPRTHAHPLAALSDRFCSSPLWIHANASNTRPPRPRCFSPVDCYCRLGMPFASLSRAVKPTTTYRIFFIHHFTPSKGWCESSSEYRISMVLTPRMNSSAFP